MTLKGNKKRNLKSKPDWKKAFIASLVKLGNVSRACKRAGISRQHAYRTKEAEEEFSETWDEAIEAGLDNLEQEVYRRAYKGVKKPVYQQGKQVGAIQEYSDTLAMFLLKGGRPEKYRDRTEITGGLNINPPKPLELMNDDELTEWNEKLQSILSSRAAASKSRS